MSLHSTYPEQLARQYNQSSNSMLPPSLYFPLSPIARLEHMLTKQLRYEHCEAEDTSPIYKGDRGFRSVDQFQILKGQSYELYAGTLASRCKNPYEGDSERIHLGLPILNPFDARVNFGFLRSRYEVGIAGIIDSGHALVAYSPNNRDWGLLLLQINGILGVNDRIKEHLASEFDDLHYDKNFKRSPKLLALFDTTLKMIDAWYASQYPSQNIN